MNIDWDKAEIKEIDQLNCTVLVSISGQDQIISIPKALFKALVARGEQNFIDSDVEQFDGGMT